MPEPPNLDTQRLYDILDALQRPLWDGCADHFDLSVALRLMSIKSQHNISQSCFNEVVKLMREECLSNNAEKLVRKLGVSSIKIDCCINGRMLY